MCWAEGDPLLMTAALRRKVAVESLKNLGNTEMSVDAAFKVLGTVPVVNDQTVYSVVMHPESGTFAPRVIWDWRTYASQRDPDALGVYEQSEAYLATRNDHLCGGT